MGKKGQTVARPETLLRRLASTAKSDAIRLRAIELILFLQGRLELDQHSAPRKSAKAEQLTKLVTTQPLDLQQLNELYETQSTDLTVETVVSRP